MTQPRPADADADQDARMAADDTFLAALGRRVRRLRLLAELTQIELAAATGMSRSFVSLVEHGDSSLQVVRLLRLADSLHVPLAALLPDPLDYADPNPRTIGTPLVRREWTQPADPEPRPTRAHGDTLDPLRRRPPGR